MLQQLCAVLKDSHTGVNMPGELKEATEARPPIDVRAVEGKALVTDVYDDNLVRNGVRPGQEIVAIDGVPTQQYAEQRVKPYLSASTPQFLEMVTYQYYLLCGPKDQPVEPDSPGLQRRHGEEAR